MSQLAHVCIDHATIYCKNAAEMDRLFSTLGFYSRNRIHYMLPNSYFELYQPHSENETYEFFRSDAGLHSFIFWSDDIDDCYRRVVNAGYATAMPVSDFSRPANHGDPRGIASFRGFYLQPPLLPVGETAVVQQMNPELIYPQKPYPHPNTAIAMDKMFLCVPAGKEKEAADTLGAFCAVVVKAVPSATASESWRLHPLRSFWKNTPSALIPNAAAVRASASVYRIWICCVSLFPALNSPGMKRTA